MNHQLRGVKPGGFLSHGILLLTFFVHTSVIADAVFITFSEGYSGGMVSALSADGSIAAGTLITGINEDVADDEAFIWNEDDGVIPLGYLPVQGVSTSYNFSDDGQRIFGRGNGDFFFLWTLAHDMQFVTTAGNWLHFPTMDWWRLVLQF